MKVIQINSVCGIGSTGRIATDIHNILIEQGHESYIAYGRGTARNCDKTIKIGNQYDIYAHVVLTRICDNHGFGSKKATNEFINTIKEFDPDVIHMHNIHGYYINVELLFNYLKKANKPVIWTLHDCWAFTGHCAYFDYIGCEKWYEGCHNCPQKGQYPASMLLDNSKSNYLIKKFLFTGLENMTIVTPSKWLKSLAEGSFLGNYPVKVINNGIDLNVFKPKESNFREKFGLQNKFIILGVANIWTKRKGYEYFKDISAKLKDDEVIVLVGLTSKQIQSLPSNIIGITRTESTNDLSKIYSSADVFVNPTLEDNFPTTNLEALACGTPVITFDTGGSVESVDKSCGVIVEKGNLKVLLNTIRRMKECNIDSNNCTQHAKIYDKNDKYEDYIKMYSEVRT